MYTPVKPQFYYIKWGLRGQNYICMLSWCVNTSMYCVPPCTPIKYSENKAFMALHYLADLTFCRFYINFSMCVCFFVFFFYFFLAIILLHKLPYLIYSNYSSFTIACGQYVIAIIFLHKRGIKKVFFWLQKSMLWVLIRSAFERHHRKNHCFC